MQELKNLYRVVGVVAAQLEMLKRCSNCARNNYLVLVQVMFNYLENRTRTMYTTYTPCITFPTLFTCNNLIPEKVLSD